MYKEKCREINMEYKHPLYYKKHDPEFYNMIMAKGHGWQRGLFDYVHNIKEVLLVSVAEDQPLSTVSKKVIIDSALKNASL